MPVAPSSVPEASQTQLVAKWDGATWSGLGNGPSSVAFAGIVLDVAVLTNGDVVAGGDFMTANGTSRSIARWDGAAWQAMGAGMDDEVLSLKVLANGNLVAGGRFTTAGAVSANNIAEWDGIAWSQVGTGIPVEPVYGTYVTRLAC